MDLGDKMLGDGKEIKDLKKSFRSQSMDHFNGIITFNNKEKNEISIIQGM